MENSKVRLALAVFFLVVGVSGVMTALWGLKSATVQGITDVNGFRVGLVGGGLMFLVGLGMLVSLWRRINVK